VDYSTLQSRTLSRLNIGSSDPVASLADEYVNEGLHYLETAAADGWPWYRRTVAWTTTTGVSSISFSTLGTTAGYAVEKILGLRILRTGSVYNPLRLMSPEEAVDVYPSTQNRPPEAWFVEGQTIYLYPTPDAAYTIQVRVVIGETDLVGTTSTPLMPVVFHTAIVEAAALLYYQTLQDSGRTDLQEKKVGMWISRMRSYGREYQSAPRIRVRDWLF
jgi:hypothetical protein